MNTDTETTINELPRRKPRKPAPNKPAVNKTDLVLHSLGRKTGTNVDELCRLTGWQPHSVRGFLSGTVRKKLGHEVSRHKDSKGVSRYFILKPGTQS